MPDPFVVPSKASRSGAPGAAGATLDAAGGVEVLESTVVCGSVDGAATAPTVADVGAVVDGDDAVDLSPPLVATTMIAAAAAPTTKAAAMPIRRRPWGTCRARGCGL